MNLIKISITNGASGAIGNAFCSFIEQGDEVILFEPAFDFFQVSAQMYGATIKSFPMIPPEENSNEWKLDFDVLESLFSKRTRFLKNCLIINFITT